MCEWWLHVQIAKTEAGRLTKQVAALTAQHEAAGKAAAEAQRSAQTASADLQALQASHAHQKQQLESQLDAAHKESAALQVILLIFPAMILVCRTQQRTLCRGGLLQPFWTLMLQRSAGTVHKNRHMLLAGQA